MFLKALFLDLDGVFADFERRVFEMSGQHPWQLGTGRMWSIVHSDKRFFATLDFTPGALELWEGVKHYQPIFLTGAPSSQAFRDQKKEWVHAKFGAGHPVIVLPRKEKKFHSKPGHVLIDDNHELIEAWKEKGGIGLLYKGDPKKTLRDLETAKTVGYI